MTEPDAYVMKFFGGPWDNTEHEVEAEEGRMPAQIDTPWDPADGPMTGFYKLNEASLDRYEWLEAT
jgi:hypothetical protein